MARDRQRRRRGASNPGPRRSQPHRDNVPGELDHASGEVDEAEAAILGGADGEPTDLDDAALEEAALEETGDLDDDGDVDEDDRVLATTRGRSPERHRGPRFIRFLASCWAELQRVQWPDRRQVGQATAVVLGFVVVAGAYLGLADEVAKQLVDLIL